MDFEIRSATPAEQQYCYSQSTQIEGQAGCIGYLRADFGSGGDDFFASWFDSNREWKNPTFSNELDQLINTLCGFQTECLISGTAPQETFLVGRTELSNYCHAHPEGTIQGSPCQEIALRADSDKHAYILRLNPSKGNYNLYCYCYRRDFLDSHLKSAERGIRFIDPKYKELFRIEDGDQVRYFTKGGEERKITCRYIDDYHFEAVSHRGNNLYHICEFAERYNRTGCHDIIPLRQSLPENCFSALETTGEMILITKGERGYAPTGVFPQGASPSEGAAALNAVKGVTKAQEAAMVAGSMFGWGTPAADPKNYDNLGQPLKSKCRSHSAER